jgi:vitamin B12 transporter
MSKTHLLLATALAVAPLAAAAQPIVVSATRVATPVGQVPADVTVLTAATFAAQGDTTLAQALAAVPGITLVQSGGDGNQTSVFMHGANSSDVLVLLDGVPVNDPADANGAFNFGIYTLDDVERVEIIRGPMSALYGSAAIGGVINIITRRGSGAPQASLTMAGGWPAQGQGSATLSGQSGAFDYALSGALDEEAGFDATPRRMSVYTGQHDPYRAKLGSAQLGYALTDTTRVYAIYRYQATDAGFPDVGNAGPVYDDPNEFDYTTNEFLKLGITSRQLGGRWLTDLSVARLDTTLHDKNLLDANDPNAASANDHYTGRRDDAQWNNTVRLPDAGAAQLSSLTFGTEYDDDHAKDSVNETSAYGPYTSSLGAVQHTWSGHAGAQTTLANRVTLTAAIRNDAVSSFGDALTWRLGGVLALPEADARLQASVGTGFHAPSLFDLHYTDSYGDSGNPNLRPEYSLGWEAGPEVMLPGGVDLSASYFASDVRDMIGYDPNAGYELENFARAHINGVESSATLTPAPWLSATLSYTYTHILSAVSAATLRRPEHQGSASVTLTPLPGLSLTPQVQVVGRFQDDIYDNTGTLTGIGSSDPGTIVNLAASYKLDQQFTLFATGKNILGSRFEATNGLQIPGASLLAGVRATLP